MNLRNVGLILSFGLNASACSPGPMPVSQSPRDPSNPASEEGVPPLSLLASAADPNLAPRSPEDASEHAGHHQHRRSSAPRSDQGTSTHTGPGSVVYVCPMHPEVTSSSPGQCPKCGMDLVPKK